MRGGSDYRLIGFLVAALVVLAIGFFASQSGDDDDTPPPLGPEALSDVVGPSSPHVHRRAQFFTVGFEDGKEIRAHGRLVTIETRTIGELVVTSGNLSVLDPYLLFPEPRALELEVAPGTYPVDVSIAHYPNGNQRIALARVRFLDAPVVLWQMAVAEGQSLEELIDEGELSGYGVDAGAGAFVDHTAAMALWKEKQMGGGDPTTPIRSAARVNYEETREWAVVDVPNSEGANIAVFSAGQGDGFYVSYWGYDAAGRIAALVTDFDLLGDLEGSDGEGG